MRKLLNTVLLTAIIFLGFIPVAQSAVLTSQFVSKQVKNDIITQLKQDYNGEIEVKIKSLPYQSIKIPDGKVKIRSEINGLNSIVKVNIYVDRIKVKTFGARAEIKIKDKVWVAQDWIKRGGILTGLTMEKKDVSSIYNKLPRKDFEPGRYRARINIKPGKIIELNNIEEIPTIVRNSPVSLIFKTPTVSVTIPAIAITSGKTGDFIKVKSKAYRKNYVGKIIGKNLVLVNI